MLEGYEYDWSDLSIPPRLTKEIFTKENILCKVKALKDRRMEYGECRDRYSFEVLSPCTSYVAIKKNYIAYLF
jgi:hypothetical protein